MSDLPIPISKVVVEPEAEPLVLGVLRSGQLVQGPLVERFEDDFARLCGTRHAVAVSNGTVSLVAALSALGIGAGDEVITTPFTFVATVNAILEVGATAVLADISLDDYCLDPAAVDAAVTPRTAAVMPVHLYGQTADMTALGKLAAARSLAVVEDAAQAHGARCGGRPAGSFGVGSFSFYATKNLATGEGGMVTTDDDGVAGRIRLLRNQGRRDTYRYEVVGHNWRMTELAAALGLPALARLAERTATRNVNATELSQRIAGVPGLVAPVVQPGREHVWHQYTLRLEHGPAHRDAMVRHLQDRGVGHGVYYPLTIDAYDCYQCHPRVRVGPIPLARQAAASVLSVPVHPFLSPADKDRIVEALRTGAA